MTIIKKIVDCMFDGNRMLDWARKEIVELQTYAKQILRKVPNFEFLRPQQSFTKKCTESIPLVEFVDGFDCTLESSLKIIVSSKNQNHQQTRPIVLTLCNSLCFLLLWLIQFSISSLVNIEPIFLFEALLKRKTIYIKGSYVFRMSKNKQTQYGLNVTVHIQIQPESYSKQFDMICFFIKTYI